MSPHEDGVVAVITTEPCHAESRAVRRGGVWHFLDREGYAIDAYTETARLLVIIDAEDRGQVKWLMTQVRDRAFALSDSYPGIGSMTEAMQAALRGLVAPPRLDEPQGLGAVVEDEDGMRWTRTLGTGGKRPWGSDSGTFQRFLAYADIDAVRVLSEGVHP